MNVSLHGEQDISVSELHEVGLRVEGTQGVREPGALQLFAVAFAQCTFAVLAGYAHRINADSRDLRFRLRWRYEEKPLRIGAIEMDIQWPGLPESRLDAAQRAAAMCTLHNTLKDSVDIETLVHN
jgi:uncharacterized OsmC-like protein